MTFLCISSNTEFCEESGKWLVNNSVGFSSLFVIISHNVVLMNICKFKNLWRAFAYIICCLKLADLKTSSWSKFMKQNYPSSCGAFTVRSLKVRVGKQTKYLGISHVFLLRKSVKTKMLLTWKCSNQGWKLLTAGLMWNSVFAEKHTSSALNRWGTALQPVARRPSLSINSGLVCTRSVCFGFGWRKGFVLHI